MGIFDYFRTKETPPTEKPKTSAPGAGINPGAESRYFASLTGSDVTDFLRGGSGSGNYISAQRALENMAVLRCVRLISESIGMLPIHIFERGPDKARAEELPIYGLLKSAPNNWQTAYEFKSQMQANALLHGNAYALIVRSMGRVIRLVPLDPTLVTPELSDTWQMTYKYQSKNGGTKILQPGDIMHLRDLSLDGVSGVSRVKLAKDAITLAINAENAAANLFKNGVMAGGALKHPGTLSTEAYERLQQSIQERYSGAANSGKWMILEEAMSAEQFAQTAQDSQHIENRKHQIEEIARAFGVPRPLLMMDDTSWGSGIEQLAIFFIQYTLAPWFTAWEQAIERSLLSEGEKPLYYAKFNERALLRGTLKDQADFFAKALGSGGHSPWLSVNEVRDLSDLPQSGDAGANDIVRMNTNEPENPA
jgi:HK97 family phage portal protein